MKKSKLLLALVLGIFVVFSSCKKKDLSNGTNSQVNNDKFEIPVYKFSNTIKIADKNGISADITIYADEKYSLNYQIKMIPVYELQTFGDSDENDNNVSDEEFIEKPPVYFDIKNVKLPGGAVGFKISQQSVNKWDNTIFAYSSECDGGFITKTNSSGKTNYKMGVLYTGSQWFYNTVASGTLKTENSAAQSVPGDFYKMYIKYKNKKKSTCDAYFFWLN